MTDILDFNAFQQPTLTVVMKDKNRTVLHLCAPTVEVLTRLRANLAALQKALSGADAQSSRAVYTLASELFNCNLDAVTVSRDDLPTVYGMNLEDMGKFYEKYLEFIAEIENAKN